jgi:hypothetical protein
MPSATRSVPDTILDVLARSTTVDNRLDLPGQLDPAEYRIIKKVINDLGGTWNRKAGTHLWPAGAETSDVIEPVLLTGLVTDERKQFDAFYTPPDIAGQVIAAADIGPGSLILEPSAGTGALALLAAEALHAAGPSGTPPGAVDAYELRDLTWPGLTDFGTHPLIGCPGEPRHWVNADDTLDLFTGIDFLAVDPTVRTARYSRVVMNPPFSHQQDMRHVLHAARFVAPGGRLVAIMSPAFQFRTTPTAREFRAWLDEHPHTNEALPDGAFKTAGTGVRTNLLTVDL